MRLEECIKEQAHAAGFELAGIASAGPADGFEHLQSWLAHGFAGSMDYMARHEELRRHPQSVLPTVRSVLMVGMNYLPMGTDPATEHQGQVARYAHGLDYHDVLCARLNELLHWIQDKVPGTQGRGVVDTAPLLERDFARRAGLGWFGKNTMLIHKKLGSYFFLGALLLDLNLEPDEPFSADHCGTCTACLDACPTVAFPSPHVLDARRCISYLTIELRGPIPTELREPTGQWVFGCDICQEVCPWNRKAPPSAEPAWRTRPDLQALDLLEIMGLDEEAFRQRFKGTALFRAKRGGLLRNAAIVLGNQRQSTALPVLTKALTDGDPVVREAVAWAISKIKDANPA